MSYLIIRYVIVCALDRESSLFFLSHSLSASCEHVNGVDARLPNRWREELKASVAFDNNNRIFSLHRENMFSVFPSNFNTNFISDEF